MAYSTESCCPRTKHLGVLQQLQIAKNQARLWEWPPLVNCMVHKRIDKRGGNGIGNFANFRGKGLFRWRHIQWRVKDGEWNGAHSFNKKRVASCMQDRGRMSQNSWRVLDSVVQDSSVKLFDSFCQELVSTIQACMVSSISHQSVWKLWEKAQLKFLQCRISVLAAKWSSFFTKE